MEPTDADTPVVHECPDCGDYREPGEPCDCEDEDDCCPACAGSGEGMADGTVCWSCRGRGHR